MSMSIRFCALALVLSATTAHAAIQDKLVSMLERQAADVQANAPDCDKIADALMSHVSQDRAVAKEAQAADKGKTKKQKDDEQAAMLVTYGARLSAAQKKLEPVRACRSNPKIRAWKKAAGM